MQNLAVSCKKSVVGQLGCLATITHLSCVIKLNYAKPLSPPINAHLHLYLVNKCHGLCGLWEGLYNLVCGVTKLYKPAIKITTHTERRKIY